MITDWIQDGFDIARASLVGGLYAGIKPRGALRLLRSVATGRRDLFIPLAAYAADQPDALAVDDGTLRLTYGELYDRARSLATMLVDLGVRKRQRVGVLVRNKAEWFIAMAGILQLGAVPAPMSPFAPQAKTRKKLSTAGLVAVVIEADLAGWTDLPKLVVGEPWDTPARWLPIAIRRGDEPDMMLFTSGTTGASKGARIKMRGARIGTAFRYMRGFDVRRGDGLYTPCPLYHAAPMLLSSLMLGVGGSVHTDASFSFDRMLDSGATHAFLVPTLIQRLLRTDGVERLVESRLRYVINGGAALRPDLKREFLRRLGPRLIDFYGATELGIVTIASPHDLSKHPESVGRLMPGIEARLVDDDQQPVARGEPGELWVRSDMISGYEGIESDSFLERAGYATAGDIARIDDGYVFLVDRKKDMIVSGGSNVFPAEVEAVIARFEGVEDVAVAGRPDDEWGEAVNAWVVGEVDHDALLAYCREHLDRHELPKAIHAIDELPRTPTGKVQKTRLP
ncbi:MAG: acyl--CoA ligase [Proteobacteria bacterium]|nr:acyl--CoA ligase [Pseudomonadota bacterium]MCP4921312.1 acyl--CoA ligase [Pseudomonadota bacterium]